MKSPGVNIESRDEQKLTPLHMACVFGNYSCARFYMLNMMRCGKIDFIRILIDAGADLVTRDEKAQSAMHKVKWKNNWRKSIKLFSGLYFGYS